MSEIGMPKMLPSRKLPVCIGCELQLLIASVLLERRRADAAERRSCAFVTPGRAGR